MNISDIKDLIAQQRLDVALEAARALAEQTNNGDLTNNMIGLQARHAGMMRDQRQGIVAPDDLRRERARLVYALNGFLDDISGNPVFDFVVPGDVGPVSPPDPAPSKPEEETILFLASNTSKSAKLQLRREHGDLSGNLQTSDHKHNYRLYPEHNVSVDSFSEAIRDQRPVIVHFAGHGLGEKSSIDSRSGRDYLEQQEKIPSGILVWNADMDEPLLMGPDVLKEEFDIAVTGRGIPIRLVVLNACYSEEQAKAIAEVVPYVIGATAAIKDQAALGFARAFYNSLANGDEIPLAFRTAVNRARNYGEPRERFVLFKPDEAE